MLFIHEAECCHKSCSLRLMIFTRWAPGHSFSCIYVHCPNFLASFCPLLIHSSCRKYSERTNVMNLWDVFLRLLTSIFVLSSFATCKNTFEMRSIAHIFWGYYASNHLFSRNNTFVFQSNNVGGYLIKIKSNSIIYISEEKHA